jgi:hypothetical protein
LDIELERKTNLLTSSSFVDAMVNNEGR